MWFIDLTPMSIGCRVVSSSSNINGNILFVDTAVPSKNAVPANIVDTSLNT